MGDSWDLVPLKKVLPPFSYEHFWGTKRPVFGPPGSRIGILFYFVKKKITLKTAYVRGIKRLSVIYIFCIKRYKFMDVEKTPE